jgi:glucosamine 6-phosphate synthetase-like amidotransferase/phosphosugar isomerase protein
MCGIAGFSIADKDHRKIDARRLSAALLLEIQARGKDATGATWWECGDDKCELFYAKDAVPATHFVKNSLFQMPRYVRTALLHTRWATLGDPENNDNNHPIVIPNGMVGVHNGHIQNHREIFARLGVDRIAQVDSEAIFQLITHSPKPLEELWRLRGNAAIGWYDVHRPKVMHLARLKGSPLWTATTPNGTLIFASTQPLLDAACRKAGVHVTTFREVPEYTYMKVRNGKVLEEVALKDEGDIPTLPFVDAATRWYFR